MACLRVYSASGVLSPLCTLWRCAGRVPMRLTWPVLPIGLACSSSGLAPGYENLPQLSDASDVVKRSFDLEFASQKGWNKAATADMVKRLQTRPGDTGSTSVQVGALTLRIRYLTEHMKINRKDKDCLRSLLKLLHRRRRLLFYLRRTDFQSYHQLLQELNLRTPTVQKYVQKHRK